MPSFPRPDPVDASALAPPDPGPAWVPELELERALEQRAADEQGERAERLAAIGALAGGVAHDFNNLLTVILGSAAAARAHLPAGCEADRELEEIELAAERGATLARELLHGGTARAGHADAGAVLGALEPVLRRLAGDRVVLRCERDAGLWPVAASAAAVERVATNLVANARDALPHGGVVRVSARNADLDGAAAAGLGVEPGRYVRLAVEDDGHGMDARVAAAALDPFFTTRRDRGGTGLGLATVDAIARESGGAVAIASEVGAGTTVAAHLRAPSGCPPGSAAARTPA